MSYDIMLGSQSWNITYNVSPFFREYIHPDGIRWLHGFSGIDVEDTLLNGWFRATLDLREDENLFRDNWDSPNGWGRGIDALALMAELAIAARDYPYEVFIVH